MWSAHKARRRDGHETTSHINNIFDIFHNILTWLFRRSRRERLTRSLGEGQRAHRGGGGGVLPASCFAYCGLCGNALLAMGPASPCKSVFASRAFVQSSTSFCFLHISAANSRDQKAGTASMQGLMLALKLLIKGYYSNVNNALHLFIRLPHQDIRSRLSSHF